MMGKNAASKPYLSGSSSLLLPTSHGPLTTHSTCVNPMLTRELPEHALVGSALPQSVVDGSAPKWHDMCRISFGRRPSERRWMRERMSVRRVDAMMRKRKKLARTYLRPPPRG